MSAERTPVPDNLKISLPDNYLIAIGKVCFVWGYLEWSIDSAITKFAGFELTDYRAGIITAHMTWPLKMDILSTLVDELRSEYPHLANFDQIKPILKKAQDGRNTIIHAFWGCENGVVSIGRKTARGKLKTSTRVITLTEIETVTDDIGKAAAAMIKLVVNR